MKKITPIKIKLDKKLLSLVYYLTNFFCITNSLWWVYASPALLCAARIQYASPSLLCCYCPNFESCELPLSVADELNNNFFWVGYVTLHRPGLTPFLEDFFVSANAQKVFIVRANARVTYDDFLKNWVHNDFFWTYIAKSINCARERAGYVQWFLKLRLCCNKATAWERVRPGCAQRNSTRPAWSLFATDSAFFCLFSPQNRSYCRKGVIK